VVIDIEMVDIENNSSPNFVHGGAGIYKKMEVFIRDISDLEAYCLFLLQYMHVFNVLLVFL
jgi:hypothetical protein